MIRLSALRARAAIPRRRWFVPLEPARQRLCSFGPPSTPKHQNEQKDAEAVDVSATGGETKKKLWEDRALVKQLSILTGSQLILNLGYAQLVPVMPLFAAEWGGHLGVTGVGLVLAAPSVARLFLNVPFGRLCDTWGRVPLMKAGTAMTAVGTVATGFCGSLWTMFPCRMLVGAGSSSSMSGSSAYMQDLSDRAPEHRAKIMGLQGMVVGSVWVVGPAIGGYLAETYGLQNSFIIAGAGAALCSLGYAFLPETLQKASVPAKDTQPQTLRESYKEWRDGSMPLLRSKNQQALIAMACSWPLRFSCFGTVVALHASEIVAAGPKEIGVMYTAMALSHGLAMPVGSYLADKAQGAKKGLVIPAGLCSAAAFGSLAFATSIEHYYLSMAIQGVCAGFLQPAIGAFTAEVTPADKRGQAMSFQRQAGDGISLLGPVGLGMLADLTCCPTAILLTSGMMAGCNLVYLFRAHRSDL